MRLRKFIVVFLLSISIVGLTGCGTYKEKINTDNNAVIEK